MATTTEYIGDLKQLDESDNTILLRPKTTITAVSGLEDALAGKAASSHGTHVPTPESVDNARFLRNDNTWAAVTPTNIGAAASNHSHAWSAITGKPSTFAPSSHSHAISDISGLQSALNGKAASSHTHDYLPLYGGTVANNLTVNGNIKTYSDMHSIVPTTGGWERGLFMRNRADDSSIAGFGMYGNGDSVSYMFVGKTFNSAVAYFYPDGLMAVNMLSMGARDKTPYLYADGFKLYIVCNGTTWCIGETGITKNGEVKIQ